MSKLAAVVLLVLIGARADAQTTVAPGPAQGAFPEATFGVAFRKYTPPANVFSPYYSWDAQMAFDVTVSRVGTHEVRVASIFETVGTSPIGSRVAVGGTGYVIRASYARQWSPTLAIAAGVAHLSSHLTRDLDEKTADERALGLPVPHVADAPEYNAVFLEAQKHLTRWRTSPSIAVVLQPLNFRFDGRHAAYMRPLFLATRWQLLARGRMRLTAESQHEIGRRPWTVGSLFLELYARGGRDSPLQLYVTVSPGHSIRTSPQIGGFRDGLAFGLRMRFTSSSS